MSGRSSMSKIFNEPKLTDKTRNLKKIIIKYFINHIQLIYIRLYVSKISENKSYSEYM